MARSLFDNFVVLMLENRSLDHLLRYLGIADRIPRGEATNSLKPSDNSSETFCSRRGAITPRLVRARRIASNRRTSSFLGKPNRQRTLRHANGR
jgi:hypothetical protein